MFASYSIRAKLLIGTAMIFVIVALLSYAGIRGAMSYRGLVRAVSERAAELPLADDLTDSIIHLRDVFNETREDHENRSDEWGQSSLRFEAAIDAVERRLERYEGQLKLVGENGSEIVDLGAEMETVRDVHRHLDLIRAAKREGEWFERYPFDDLGDKLDDLTARTRELPSHQWRRMLALKGRVRGQYRVLSILTWVTSFLAVIFLVMLVKFFYVGIFGPLHVLVNGSRRVANGDFTHRIQLSTQDEMSQLATAMNEMTRRFCEIRDDLDQQVKQRTKEVVRSEQMASVGFLAAGVAHEINNPLASIAWSAESLESRLHEILYVDADETQNEEVEVLRTYLRRIQDEAFRCKGITEALLDFSRMSDVERHNSDLREIVEDVIEIVKHLGRYRNKHIEFVCRQPVIARVNTQEIKQVVLNLITNALDSLDQSGTVQVELRRLADQAELMVIDNGCGMTEEVREHLFEPFFTRRRDGQGTGLGLSITYRIVVDHGGSIEPHSGGPGKGSSFRVTLPLVQHEEELEVERQVA